MDSDSLEKLNNKKKKLTKKIRKFNEEMELLNWSICYLESQPKIRVDKVNQR